MLLKLLKLIFSKIMFLFGRIKTEKAFEKPLSAQEEAECFEKLKLGDKLAEEKLVKHNLRLVAHIAQKYKGKFSQDELISTGSIGLLKAIKTYSVSKGNSFSTYATRCIENEILMMLRANKKYANQVFLDDAIMSDKDGNQVSLIEVVPDFSDNIIDNVHTNIAYQKVQKIIESKLTEREKQVVYMRYGLCGYSQYTQIEISKILGISRSYISRIEKYAIDVIRKNISQDVYK